MHRLKTILFVFVFLSIGSVVTAQNDHWWWYEIHDYDGYTPWQRYLIQSPAYFGPNAFPLPQNYQGLLTKNAYLETALEGHFNAHENTENLFGRLFIPLLKEKVGIEVSMVPFEVYAHDTLIRDERFSRNYDGKGTASGDVYIGTQIQLLKNHSRWPDLLLGIHIRTASGNQYEAARFADSPGYFFDVSAGKTYAVNNWLFKEIRLSGLIGFYVWQTNLAAHFQDDALLYGAGIQLRGEKLLWYNGLIGFYGYLNNGDRPLALRSRLQTQWTKKINLGFQFEHGLHDYNFRSLRLSLIYTFKS